MVEKKYVKLAALALAIVALAVGLSVGITQSKRADRNEASNAFAGGDLESGSFDAKPVSFEVSCDSKSGKSGGEGGRSRSRSPKRRLVVPGTEDAQMHMANEGNRKNLREESNRKLASDDGMGSDLGDDVMSYNDAAFDGDDGINGVMDEGENSSSFRGDPAIGGGSSKGRKSESGRNESGASKGGKSGVSESINMSYRGKGGKSGGDKICEAQVRDGCNFGSYSYNGKAGKSGGGSMGGNSGGQGSISTPNCNCGSKGGKSGGEGISYNGKAGKSGGEGMSYSGEGGKFGGSQERCTCMQPSACVVPPPEEFDCNCEDLQYAIIDGVCVRSCDMTVDGDYETIQECCMANGVFSVFDCPKDDECPVDTDTPTYFPTEPAIEADCICEDLQYTFVDGACARGCSLDEGGQYDTVGDCCDANGFFGFIAQCPKNDECPPETPVPTGRPTETTPIPTLIEITPTPTMGSTPTVSTETTSEGTTSPRNEEPERF